MKTFYKTVATVTIFSICEKFLGFIYRIFLSRSIGSEGIGLYQVALSVFALLLTLSCSGTPITVSRLMTKYKSENKPDKVAYIISSGLFFTIAFALPICIVFFVLRNHLGILFADKRCINIFLVVLPGLVFTSLYSIIRGVFWGEKDFMPYSIIELLEEIVMILVGVMLITNAVNIYDGAFKAGVAVLISYVFSFTVATIMFFARKNRLANPFPLMRPLLASSLPITAMRTANSLAVSLVSIILPLRLVAAGYTSTQALSLYGAAEGQAMPILFIPTTLIGSFTLVLVPEISENYYMKNISALRANIEKALKFTTFLSCLFIPVFIVCGEEIGILIFNSHECGKYLTVSAFLMLFMGLSSITTSILNSIGKERQTLLFYIISAVFMLLSIYFLPAVLGIYSLLVAFTFVFGITTVCNLILLNKHCPKVKSFKRFFLLAITFIIPTVIVGLMLEKMLLPLLGTFITFLLCTAVLMGFNCLLYLGFNLIDFEFIRLKFKRKKSGGKPHRLKAI